MRAKAPSLWFLLLTLLTAAPASAWTPPHTAGSSGAAGVTPGGLIYRVDGRELVLVTTSGEERARYPVAAGEKNVLAVADDGSRVTSASGGGIRRERNAGGRMRLAFRAPDGALLRSLELPDVLSNVAAFGAEAFAVAQDRSELVLHRLNAAEGDVALLRLARKKLLSETGKIHSVQVHASAAGTLVAVAGPYRTVWLHPDGTRLLPDPAIDCGTLDASPLLYPDGAGVVARVRVTYGARPVAHLERISRDGKLLSSVALPSVGSFFPLPGLGLLALQEAEAVVLDGRGNELSRTPLGSSTLSPAAAARLARARRRLEAAEAEKVSSADWVELALASPDLPMEELYRVGDDGVPGLQSFARVPDDDPDVPAARRTLPTYLGALPYLSSLESRDSRLSSAKRKERQAVALAEVERLAPAGPGWLRRSVSSWVLTARVGPVSSTDWALSAAAEAIERGESLEPPLPDRLLTRELAERIALYDRERLDADDRQPETFGEAQEADLHVSASRFPDIVLSCASGAGPARFRAVVGALVGPALTLARTLHPRDHGDSEAEVELNETASPAGDAEAVAAEPSGEDDEPRVVLTPGLATESEDELGAAGRVSALLGEAARSEDGDLRAVAALLSPFYRRPLDVKSFRRDVLPRAGVTDIATTALLEERLLSSADWTRLFGEHIASARQRSKAPAACLQAFSEMSRDPDEGEDARADPYCRLLGSAMSPDGDPSRPGRGRELAELARAPAAPPELKVFTRLGRTMMGAFNPSAGANESWGKDLLDLWQDAELPADLRFQVLEYASYGQNPNGLAEVAPALLRQLRQGRLSAQEERVVANALAKASPEDLSRIATERLLAGTWRPPDAESATAWLSRLDKGAVASDPRLRESLLRLLDDENAAPEAAAALARAGEPAALPPLLFALKTGCFG